MAEWTAATLPLPDQIELLVKQLDALQAGYKAAKARLEADITQAVSQARPLPDEVMAELYWRFPMVPVTLLWSAADVARRAHLDIARAHPYWHWACPGCGNEVPVRDRTELKVLRGRWAGNERCDGCRERDQAEDSARCREEWVRW